MISVVLPIPPSANNLYTDTPKGRRKSKKYKQWLQEAGWCLNTQKTLQLEAVPFQVNIEARIDRGRDLDNCIKPILDLLVAHKLTPDDRWCDKLRPDRVFEDNSLGMNEVRVSYATI